MALLTPVLCDDLGSGTEHGREVQEGGDICVHMMIRREGNGTPLQYSRLGNPMDGGAWWAAVHGSLRVAHD